MRQMFGDRLVCPVLPFKPAVGPGGDIGTDMTQFNAAMGVAKWAIEVSIVGGTSTNLYMYGEDPSNDMWGLLSDVGVLGQLGGGTLAAGDEYIFILHDLGWLEQFALVERNAIGATALLLLAGAGLSTNWNTTVQAKSGPGGSGNLIQVQLVASNTVAKAGTLVETNNTAVFTYLPGTSQVSDMENLITGNPSKLLSIQNHGTLATVLQAADAFGPAPLAGGTPVTTATLIEIIENNFRRAD